MKILPNQIIHIKYIPPSMQAIESLSHNEFLALFQEFIKLSYEERVKLIFHKYGYIRGVAKKIINDTVYEISLLPETHEQNQYKWEFYIKEKAIEFCRKWIDPKIKNLDKNENRVGVIKFLQAKLEKELEFKTSHRDKGYLYGVTNSSFDWLKDMPLGHDPRISPFFSDWHDGLGYYLIEKELGQMIIEEEIEDSEESVPYLDKLTFREKLTLANELGIIDFLEESYDLKSNRKQLAHILSMLFGINNKSVDFDKLYDSIKKMKAGDQSKSPINQKNITSVRNQLSSIGISLKNSKGNKK